MSHYYNNTPLTINQHLLTTPSQPSVQRRHYNTPHQSSSLRQPQQHYDTITTNTIDYKSKTFQLMQVVTEMEIRHKQMQKTTFYLQRQLQIIHKQLEQFLLGFGVDGLGQVRDRYNRMQKQLRQSKLAIEKPLIKQQKLTQQYQKILSQYKLILKTQQQKIVKYQQKWKHRENTLIQQLQLINQENNKLKKQIVQNQNTFHNKCQQISKKAQQQISGLKTKENQLLQQRAKLNQQLKKSQQQQLKQKQHNIELKSQSQQLKTDIQLMKRQFRQLIIQKQSLQQRHEKLKRKYKQQIEHFQVIEKQVQEKLIQVQKQITFYKQQRQMHLEQINSMKRQITQLKQLNQKLQQHDDQFSFRGDNHVQTQTEQSEFSQQHMLSSQTNKKQDNDMIMTSECYEISIKSLLEENNRLKRTLILLQRAKSGQELPAQAELELKLLKGLMKGTIGGLSSSNTSSLSNIHHVNNDNKLQSSKLLTQTLRIEQQNKQIKKKSTQLLAIDFIDESHQNHINQIDVYSPKFRHQIVEQTQGSQQNIRKSNGFMKVTQVKMENNDEEQ